MKEECNNRFSTVESRCFFDGYYPCLVEDDSAFNICHLACDSQYVEDTESWNDCHVACIVDEFNRVSTCQNDYVKCSDKESAIPEFSAFGAGLAIIGAGIIGISSRRRN